ncbi:MAG: TonB-dependent receptor [Gemmatimonadetes bacterium]|nr:TonB-dependent receptor [Gemmatimonadota bacterium]
MADYFKKKTDDLLVSRPITSTSGFTSVYDNIGNIENRGWEFQLSTEPIRESKVGGLSWSSDFNISFLENEVTALYRNEPFNAGIRSLNRGKSDSRWARSRRCASRASIRRPATRSTTTSTARRRYHR